MNRSRSRGRSRGRGGNFGSRSVSRTRTLPNNQVVKLQKEEGHTGAVGQKVTAEGQHYATKDVANKKNLVQISTYNHFMDSAKDWMGTLQFFDGTCWSPASIYSDADVQTLPDPFTADQVTIPKNTQDYVKHEIDMFPSTKWGKLVHKRGSAGASGVIQYITPAGTASETKAPIINQKTVLLGAVISFGLQVACDQPVLTRAPDPSDPSQTIVQNTGRTYAKVVRYAKSGDNYFKCYAFSLSGIDPANLDWNNIAGCTLLYPVNITKEEFEDQADVKGASGEIYSQVTETYGNFNNIPITQGAGFQLFKHVADDGTKTSGLVTPGGHIHPMPQTPQRGSSGSARTNTSIIAPTKMPKIT